MLDTHIHTHRHTHAHAHTEGRKPNTRTHMHTYTPLTRHLLSAKLLLQLFQKSSRVPFSGHSSVAPSAADGIKVLC